MKMAYPALIHQEEGTYWVEFPDLEGCFSDGDTLADAVYNAQDALGGYLCSLMDDSAEIPAPSPVDSIHHDNGSVAIVVTDPLRYKRSTKAVKKTLTIPEWLNTEAEKRHINFSSVLQQALLSVIE